jgi:hypothetical protein
MNFSLHFQGWEQHVCLPRYTPFILTQNLYDLLFQYVIDPVHEQNLQAFIARLEAYVKSKSRTPFSVPKKELVFLQEGLNELKLLNWVEIPVAVFRLDAGVDADTVWKELEKLMNCAYRPENELLYVYSRHGVF